MSFSLDLSKAVGNIKKNRDKIIRGTLISLSTNIIKRTPVGNPALWKSKPPKGYVGGSLRGGWQASIGTPDRSLSKRKETNNAGGQTAVEAASVAHALEMGQSFYLTNPLPYARRIEFGLWSGQAPQGMLRVSVLEAQTELNKRAK